MVMVLRLAVAFLLAVLLVLGLAGAAVGHPARDPFAPLVDPDAATGAATTTTTAAREPTVAEPQVARDADELPDTGSDPAPWFVLAFALVAGGGGLTVVSRCFGTRPWTPSSPRTTR